MNESRRDDGRPEQIPPLRDADWPLEGIFDAVNDGIFISDPKTLRFTQINKPGCAMFGYSDAELIGHDIGSLSSGIHPYTQAGALDNNERLREGAGQAFEWQCRTKTGKLFWTEISVGFAQTGTTAAVVAIIRDITRRKNMEHELKLALEKASAANTAKSTFLASVSHELRTPLNAIIGFSDLMLTQRLGPLGNPRYVEYIGDIHRSGLQLLALIDDLLDLTRIDAGKMTLSEREISLPLLIADARLTVELQAKKSDVEILIDLPAGLPNVCGDERRIMQIVLNLLSNAIKFTPRGGTVTVRTSRSANGLSLEFHDTGIGIAESDMQRVLERFDQVDSMVSQKHKGFGLGLPIVKHLIELHGGSLSIESGLGVGTTVSVLFPAHRVIEATSSAAA